MALDAGAEVPFLGSGRIIVAAVAAGRRGPIEPRGCPEAEAPLQTYDGGRKAAHASEALRQVRPPNVLVISTSAQPGSRSHQPNARPDAAHRITAAQTLIDSTKSTQSQYTSNREAKTPSKTLLTTLSNRTTS